MVGDSAPERATTDSAEAGQWLIQDPLGYVDSFNAYAFNKFDPVNFVDPWGLNAEGSGHARTRPCRDEGGVCRIPVEHKPSPAPETTCDSACQAERKSAAALERTAARASQVQEALANSPEIVMAGAATPLTAPNTTPLQPKPLRLIPGGRRPPTRGLGLAGRTGAVGMGLIVGYLGCQLIPECRKNLEGIQEEAERLDDAPGRRNSCF